MSCLPETLIFSVAEDATQGVRYVSATGPRKQLRCSAEEGVFSPTAKFTVEPAKDGLVHIRSCYDNHYWVRASTSEPWLCASTPKPENDNEKDECTLLEPRIREVNGEKWVSFVHHSSQLNLVMLPQNDSNAYNLSVVRESAPTEFGFVDYASLLKLPKYVMFKSDGNNNYLRPESDNFQYFRTKCPTTDGRVAYETLVNRDGDIRFKTRISTCDKPMFWTCWPASGNTYVFISSPADGIFPEHSRIFRLYEDVENCSKVLIRWWDRNYYCICLLNEQFAGYYEVPKVYLDPGFTILSPADPSRSYVTVTEFRHPHRVINQTFGIEDYTSSPLVFENESDQDVEEDIIKKDDQHHRTKYRFTNSITHGQCSANFTTKMPLVTEQGQLVIPDNVVSLCPISWGETNKYCNNNNNNCGAALPLVTVPANTRVTATLLAKIATYEIPFSYELLEEYYTGGGGTYQQDDGVFTGIYSYGYEVRIDKTEPLEHAASSNTQD